MDRVATAATNSISVAHGRFNLFSKVRGPEGRCSANLDSSDSQPSLRDWVFVSGVLTDTKARRVLNRLGSD